jgi:hypothetical protein
LWLADFPFAAGQYLGGVEKESRVKKEFSHQFHVTSINRRTDLVQK